MMRTPMEHTGFPSEETLAAFIDGRLDDETRRRVVEHMAGCTECYETFLGATEWGRERTDQLMGVRVARTRRRPRILAVSALAAAVAVAVFIAQPIRDWYCRLMVNCNRNL